MEWCVRKDFRYFISNLISYLLVLILRYTTGVQWTPDDFYSGGVSMCAKLAVPDQGEGGTRSLTVTTDVPLSVSRTETAKKKAVK